MQVNRGPNLFTMTEDIGPTSMMKPAKMLPTWKENEEMLFLLIKILTNEILPFPAPSKWASSGFTKIPNE